MRPYDDTVMLTGKRKTLVRVFMTVLAVLLSAAALSLFAADRLKSFAALVLDDERTEYQDTRELSRETLPVYARSMDALAMARAFSPFDETLERSLGYLYFRLAVWADAVRKLGAETTDAASSSAEYRGLALLHMRSAIALDPANAQQQVLLGAMLAESGDGEGAGAHLDKALALGPMNASLRYAAAMQFMMTGKRDRAMQEAKALAAMDDGYLFRGTELEAHQAREQRMPSYELKLSSSYLYRSLEMLWRLSGKDRTLVERAVPENADAREVLRLFWEQKGDVR